MDLKLPWLNARGAKSLPVYRQSTATECGLACVAMVASSLGISTDLPSLRRRYDTSLKGVNLQNVMRCCTELGLATRAVRCDFGDLKKLRLPCVLHWRFNHFVVLKGLHTDGLVLHDPARGLVIEADAEAAQAFTGVALEISPSQEIRQVSPLRQLRLKDLLAQDTDLGGKFAAGLTLALICELLLLTTPFYLQIVIDQVLAKGDAALLSALVIVFSALLGIQLLGNIMRQLTFQYLSHVTVFDISRKVLRRLLSLPLRFFRGRELGDIQHRIQSLSRIQAFIVQSAPALILDSIFVFLISGVMLFYDAQLTAMVLAALLFWGAWRLFILPRTLRLSADIAQAESAVQTHLLESLRAVQSIKLVNGELHRELEWCDRFATATNARIRAGNLRIVDGSVRQTLFQGVRIAAVYSLATQGLDGQVSIGMISAFIAYLGMFTTRGCGIVDRLQDYKLLQVPLERLADVIFSDEEERAPSAEPCTENRTSDDAAYAVELHDVAFSYSRYESDVLRHCCAAFPQHSFTAIAGASGVGKSSLLQIIAGSESISAGELLINGRSSHRWHANALRSRLAAVLQGDSLLKGSIAENIALVDPEFDLAAIRKAAAAACIADDIEALPMAYETRIGDLGSSLSRGQVQRLLLARAFYRRPALLLLDEATSGLDVELEKDVIRSISEFPATKIVVTHSDRMLEAADRVLWLHDRRLISSRPELKVWGSR